MKKAYRYELLALQKHDLTRTIISFFYTHTPGNIILKPFVRETFKWLWVPEYDISGVMCEESEISSCQIVCVATQVHSCKLLAFRIMIGNMILRPFIKWFRLNSTTQHWLRETQLFKRHVAKVLTFTRKTVFHELKNTAYICSLHANYHSEWKKLWRMNLLCCNTHDLTFEKISFVYT